MHFDGTLSVWAMPHIHIRTLNGVQPVVLGDHVAGEGVSFFLEDNIKYTNLRFGG